MTHPGPKPLPRNVRVLSDARAAATAAPDDKQPDPPVKIPKPPSSLSERERVVFVEMAKKLAGMRVMTEADVEALVIFARNWVVALEAHQKVEDRGVIVKSPNGHPVQNPYFSIARKAEDRCMRILAEFGMTPSSRVRVSVN